MISKKEFKERIRIEKDYKRPIKWAIEHTNYSSMPKDKQKDLINFMCLIADGILEEAKKQYESILNDASKGYIRIEQIPNYEDIFGSIDDMIKSNQESMKHNKEKIVKRKKEKDKLKDYEKIKNLESDIWWDEHRIEGYEKEIRFLRDMQLKIIREAKWKFANDEKSEGGEK